MAFGAPASRVEETTAGAVAEAGPSLLSLTGAVSVVLAMWAADLELFVVDVAAI